MKNYLALFLLFIAALTFGQTKKIDSLNKILKSNNIKDTTKISAYLALSDEYIQINLDSLSQNSKKAFGLSLTNNNYRLSEVYNFLGIEKTKRAKLDSAKYFFDEALKILETQNNNKIKAWVLNNYSTVYQGTENFNKKIEYISKAIDLLDEKDSFKSLLYYNLAVIYGQSLFYKESNKYSRLAYNSSKRTKNIRVEAAALRTLAFFFIEDEKLDSARIYLERGLDICERTKSPEICFGINHELGNLYNNLQMYDKAREALLNSKKFALVRKEKFDIMSANMYLGDFELSRDQLEKAILYFEEFDIMYKELPMPQLGVTVYKSWAEAEAKRKNFKKSNLLLQKYTIIKDSVFSQQNRTILANADAKYETEKKDKELAEQNLQIEKQSSELQKKKSQYTIMTGLAIFLLLTSVLTWFLYQQRQKRKNQEIVTLKREQQVKTLESLMEGEEKERIRIAQELHDGVNVDLSAIKYKLTSLLEKNNKVINEAVAMIDKSCEQVRAISHNLVPPALKDFSLVEALQDYCSTANTVHTPEVSFQHIGDPISISKKVEVTIFRIVQELVNNSLKHAEASEIDVQISNRVGIIQITVEDNGKGFNKDETVSNGIGLKNIHSRIDYLNAKLDFNSGKDGTSYTIDINTEGLA